MLIYIPIYVDLLKYTQMDCLVYCIAQGAEEPKSVQIMCGICENVYLKNVCTYQCGKPG